MIEINWCLVWIAADELRAVHLLLPGLQGGTEERAWGDEANLLWTLILSGQLQWDAFQLH